MSNLDIKIPKVEDLFEVFESIKNSKYQGVLGVCEFDSRNPGPTLGITIQTHGNEISGLATLWYFLKVNQLEKLLKKGKVVFVLNNIKATERYFEAKTDEERSRARFVDVNFNRLPENFIESKNDLSYEILRAQELKKIWEIFDIGLDIHSTSQKSKPMIIAIHKLQKDLIKGFPIDIVISNIENIQIGVPPTVFYGGKREVPVLAVETGSHEHQESFKIAIECVLSLMKNLNIIPGDTKLNSKNRYLLYEVVDSLVFPNDSYKLEKIYPIFSSISKGELIATGNDRKIYSPISGCALFGPKQVRPHSTDEEVLFFTKAGKKLVI